jgi:hypothetical protein
MALEVAQSLDMGADLVAVLAPAAECVPGDAEADGSERHRDVLEADPLQLGMAERPEDDAFVEIERHRHGQCGQRDYEDIGEIAAGAIAGYVNVLVQGKLHTL